MAKAINRAIPDGDTTYGVEKYCGSATASDSLNSSLVARFLSTLVGDCRIILDIYTGAHYERLLAKSGVKEDKDLRNKVRKELFSEQKRKQYGNQNGD